MSSTKSATFDGLLVNYLLHNWKISDFIISEFDLKSNSVQQSNHNQPNTVKSRPKMYTFTNTSNNLSKYMTSISQSHLTHHQVLHCCLHCIVALYALPGFFNCIHIRQNQSKTLIAIGIILAVDHASFQDWSGGNLLSASVNEGEGTRCLSSFQTALCGLCPGHWLTQCIEW